MKTNTVIKGVGIISAIILLSCKDKITTPNPEDFDSAVIDRGKIQQEDEFPETPIGDPDIRDEGSQYCSYQKMKASAGHTEFLSSYPYSGMHPSQMYFLSSFDDGGYKIFPARLRPATLSWDLINSTGGIVCTMNQPTTSEYRQCQQQILASSLSGVTPARLEYKYIQIYNENQINLAIDASFSGFFSKFKSMFDFTKTSRKTFVWVEFTQVYYTVEVDIRAEKPSDWFLEPDASKLNQEGSLVYIHSMKYGRRLFLAIASSFQYEMVKEVVEASYNGFAASGDINLTFQQQQVFRDAEINAFVFGGGAEPAISLITDITNLKDYLKAGANYSKDSPGELIGFTLRYLSDNSVARHVSAAEYIKRDCTSSHRELTPAVTSWGSPANRQWGHDDWDTGPVMKGSVRLSHSNNRISASILFEFIEGIDYKRNCGTPNRNTICPGHTYAIASATIPLYQIPDNEQFVSFLDGGNADIVEYIDTQSNNHLDNLSAIGDSFVTGVVAQGNTDGDDLPSGCWGRHEDDPRGGCGRSWVEIKFGKLKIKVRPK